MIRSSEVNVEEEFIRVEQLTKDVDGRTDIEEAKLLYQLAKKGEGQGAIVEIGSFQGYSTIWLASGSRDRKREKVYAVDPHCTDLHGHNEIIFRENIKRAGVDNYVIPVVKTSTDAAKDWNMPIRLLFIDGAHDYENVKNDFLLWEKHLIYGGIVVFHDSYCIFWPDVGEVVNEYVFNSDRFSDIGCVNTIIYATKVKELSPVQNAENEDLKRRLLPREKAVCKFQEAESMIKKGANSEAEKLLMLIEDDVNVFITPEYSLLNLNNIGNCYRRIGRYERAEEIFYEILAHKYDSSLVHKKYRTFLSLGDLYLAQNKYMESIDKYKEAVSKDGFFKKGRSQALLGLGNCYYALDNYYEAEQNFTKALAMEDISGNESYYALLGLGRCYYALKNYNKAEEKYSKALSIKNVFDSIRVDAVLELGRCYSARGKDNAAEKEYIESLNSMKMENIQKYRLLNRLGTIYLHHDIYNEAENRFSEALSIENVPDQDRYHALVGIGKCFQIQGKYLDAEKQYKEAFSYNDISDKSKIEAANLLTECYFARKKFRQVRGFCREIMSLKGIDDEQKKMFIDSVKEKIDMLSSMHGGASV